MLLICTEMGLASDDSLSSTSEVLENVVLLTMLVQFEFSHFVYGCILVMC